MQSRAIPSINDSIILARWEQVALQENLDPNTPEYRERRKSFLSAELRREFSQLFGVDVESLNGWQKLCITIRGDAVKIEDLTSVKKCKNALKGHFVNIFDLVDAGMKGISMTPGEVFHNRRKLAEYTKETDQIFPKRDAKPVPLLAHFLIVLGGAYRKRR
ncbi:hypothetical protein K435DRAFT_777821 [Dendrothele bispora CBS 962.96]|uniref:Uncharacterized protein n=1 Tax=Dendrothele bispora (strain CBS 962.96) TaxID=1314807 RepID=A0A4V4HCN9_DENBC|nr:hypothetical protein K435DRAFT_784006 [Dendrothele bispora CBS 962.96]THU97731.1 hypothetical protein K435DRAFT_777821 [Dendrothele bispora CBS 962.96]